MWRLTPRAAVFIAAVALLVVLAFWVGGYQASRPLKGKIDDLVSEIEDDLRANIQR